MVVYVQLKSVLENKTKTFLLDFEIQTDRLISSRRPHLAIPADYWIKLKENQQRDNNVELAKRSREHAGDIGTTCKWCTWKNSKRSGKATRRPGNKRTNEEDPDYSIIIIGQNTEKGLGDSGRLAITQTPVKNHQLTFVRKTFKIIKIIVIITNRYIISININYNIMNIIIITWSLALIVIIPIIISNISWVSRTQRISVNFYYFQIIGF